MLRHSAIVVALTAGALACRHPARTAPIGAVPSGWRTFADGYLEETFRARPAFAVRLGRHELDGEIDDLSPEGRLREAARLRDARARALAFDAAALDADDRYERALLLAHLRAELFWLERARAPWRNCMSTAQIFDPGVYVVRPYAPLEQRAKALARYARNLPRATEQLRALLERPLPRPHAETCAGVYAGLADFLEKDAPAAFAGVRDPAASAELAAALTPAVQAVRELAAWFEEQIPSATGSFALGARTFEEMVRDTEGVDRGLDALEAMARGDLEANLAALRDACASFAPGADVPACVARESARKPADGPVARARAQLPMLKRFLEEHALVSIPGPEEARVAETPRYERFNLAFLRRPGPYDPGGLPAFYYVTPPDPAWSPEERQAYLPAESRLLFISVHEVWPGHFLQWQHLIRARWPIAKALQSYAFVEGWAHYAEQLMWEAGYGGGDPEVRIGQLLDALLRDVRFLSAIGLHAKGMTIEESERLFRELAFQDPGNARQQARRGAFDPGYLNYTLGKLLILELREEFTASRGGRSAWREFHDRLLGLGAPPVPIARAMLLGTPLP